MRIWITGDDCLTNKQAVADALAQGHRYWSGSIAEIDLGPVSASRYFDARVVMHQGHAHIFTPDNLPRSENSHEDSTFEAIKQVIEPALFFCRGSQ